MHSGNPTALCFHIVDVIPRTAFRKMFGIAATWIVARMKQVRAGGYVPSVMVLKHEPMHVEQHSVLSYLPVSMIIGRALPFNAARVFIENSSRRYLTNGAAKFRSLVRLQENRVAGWAGLVRIRSGHSNLLFPEKSQ